MTLDSYATAVADLDPDPGEVETAELVVTDDVLVKAFVLGPDAAVDPHEETLAAPAVVENERGAVHGARNDTNDRAVLTASLAPLN